MESITIYAQRAMVEGDGNNGTVTFLTGVDLDQVAQELDNETKLNSIEFSDVIEYVVRMQAEEADE